MSLTDIPDLAITTILEKLDFRSILNLRNVCHGSRKHIENTIPPLWISRIKITVATDKIDLHLEDVGSSNYSIRYLEEGVETFWDDFQRLLKHQKSSLNYFNLVLHFQADEKLKEKTILDKVYSEFLQRLQSLLKSQKHPLKVQKRCLIVGDQNEIMSILPYLDSKELESLQESPNLQTFDLHFEPDHSSLVLRRMIRNVFREAYVDETSLTDWYSRIPDSPEYILSARSSYFSWITFSRSKM
ncbi:Protein CBG04841 [Caenorhabditis briggsae]|uniref:Protein CBG04841 n=1 Tax=Caenorhabditis briggsae TaxID=6238 RepID=A8WYL5_CAEBR|nr:Protein CBG04841 [Caenorhabditis briggsae]CAP25473.2 Protein CBG04841 [Caenorhabditis briggsae]